MLLSSAPTSLRCAPHTAREAVTALGPVDVLVNNVGHRDRRGVDALAPGDLTRLLGVHLIAAYALSQAVARDLTSRGRPGRISPARPSRSTEE